MENARAGAEEQPSDVTAWLFDGDSFTPLAKFIDGRSYTIISDHIGAPSAMVAQNGETVWGMELDLYGRPIKRDGGGKCPFRFPGQYEDDETGLYYNRFRYYDPESGMYTQSDPIGLEGGNPTLYGYVRDPNKWIDPFGLVQHHLIPQEMLRNLGFMRQLNTITNGQGTTYLHRQIANIDSNIHQKIHRGAGGGAWNRDFRNWANQNRNFSQRDLQRQIREMMRNHNVPRSSRNFARRYGRQPRSTPRPCR